MSEIFTCGLSDLLLLAVSCFCIARINFKKFTYSTVLNINYARSEILAFLNKLLIFFFTKLTIKSQIY